MDTKRKGTERRNPGDEMIVTSIRLERDLHARFKDYAWAQRRSQSDQIRVLIEDAVKAYEEETAA